MTLFIDTSRGRTPFHLSARRVPTAAETPPASLGSSKSDVGGACRACGSPALPSAPICGDCLRKAARRGRPKGFVCSAKTKAKIAEALRGVTRTPETRAKTSEIQKARHARRLMELGLHADEIPEYRAVRAKGFSAAEAATIIIRSRKKGEAA